MFLLLSSGCLVDEALYQERLADLTDHDADGVVQQDDCDDADPGVFPDADERCDGVDQDCDGALDEDAVDAAAWYADSDADGYGTGAPTLACDAPTGTASNNLDCDDGEASVHPDAAETPYDGADQDCDGGDLTDVDDDGYDAMVAGGDDCDDADDAVAPGMDEVPYDGVDQDCSSTVEGQLGSASNANAPSATIGRATFDAPAPRRRFGSNAGMSGRKCIR